MIVLELPYPPSMNTYWRRVGARTLISRKGRAYRKSVCSLLAAPGVRPLDGPLEMLIDAYPPDRRRRDVDNLQKPLLDALEHAGVYHNDCQVKRLVTEMFAPLPDGLIVVRIQPYQQRSQRGATPLSA